MRKIALLVALALIISVGGVYATWRYSTQAVTAMDFNLSDKLSITMIDQTDGSKGSISAPNSLALTIDDDNGDHVPDWDSDIADSAGSLTVKFTPNIGASSTSFKYYITVDKYTYHCDEHNEDINIFNPTDADTSVEGLQILSGTLVFEGGKADVSKAYTAAEIQTLLNLNTNITLDSIEKYTHYSEAVGKVSLVLHVEEVPATP